MPVTVEPTAAVDRDRQHAVEAVGQEMGDAAGRHQHGDHQDDAHRLERGDDGQRQQAEQQVVEQAIRQAITRAWPGSKQISSRSRRSSERHAEHHAAETERLPDLGARDAEDVAEQDVVEMHVRWRAMKSTSPKANMPENTTPITVSSLMRLLSLMKPVATAQNKPAAKAPMASGSPTM